MHNEAGWLAEDAHALQNALPANPATPEGFDCDVLIVGSGYGGAVAAARLAGLNDRTGRRLKVWVVERGREYLPGMFPSRTGELAGHVRISRQDGKKPRGNDTALWDLRLGRDVNVMLASGLGGGSLINAAVMEEPEPSVWANRWPAGINRDTLAGAYKQVRDMLQAKRMPDDRSYPKFDALKHLAAGLSGKPEVKRCHIAVAFEPQSTPHAGVPQQACTSCGDCATGCNWQAKNSLDVNYLALARRRGAQFYCGVLAQRFERHDSDGWKLHWRPMARNLSWGNDAIPIHARRLIVCAGSLGSTELLQRSQTNDLSFSETLGSAFSTNGDMIAAATGLSIPTRICGDESTPGGDPATSRGIGPTITGMLRSGDGASRFTVQEFAIPAALRPLLAEAAGSFGLLQRLARLDLGTPWLGAAREDPLAPGNDAMDRMMVYGLMGDDGAAGQLTPIGADLPAAAWDGRIAVTWPEARNAQLFEDQHAALSKAYASNRRGHYIPNPLWRPLPERLEWILGATVGRGPVTTVHPLGGCPMGNSVGKGVVDFAGRVFDGADPGELLEGLVVLDGAIVPRALGINPALTIAALAEHAMPVLISAWGLKQDPGFAPAPLPPRGVWRTPEPRGETTAIRLREQLEGPLTFDREPYWAELEVIYAPILDVVAFTRQLPRVAPVEKAWLRLYRDRGLQEDGHQWEFRTPERPPPEWTLELVGEVRVLFTLRTALPRRIWRGGRALRQSRGGAGSPAGLWRLLAQSWADVGGSLSLTGIRLGLAGIAQRFGSALAVASHLGERRGFDYHLRVQRPDAAGCPVQIGDQLRGRKRLDCSVDKNPWRQMSELTLDWRPAVKHASWVRAGPMALDLRYFVRQRSTLVEIHAQPDHATALADVAGLAMLCLRAMLKIQLLSFVPPGPAPPAAGPSLRLPGQLPGLDLESLDLQPVTRFNTRLSRYRSNDPPNRPQPGSRPVLLIHGYTASGSTFAHPSMQPNLVQHLCAQGRDVWVVELRTSIAFPAAASDDWSFDDVAKDIPPIVAAVLNATGTAKVDVVAHCIGAAMFCHAVLGDPDLHESIGALALSQVGPLLQMSPANLMRGYLASYLAQYLGTGTLTAAPPAGDALGPPLVDVLLATMPYPDRDQNRELGRAARAEGEPDFRRVRHRIDAMLGRVMELSKDSRPSDDTLAALGDMFGYARTVTLAQVIHYARLSILVGSDGRNRQLCNATVRGRMNFPVLLLHGRRSGVFDWRGSLQSHRWLREMYASPEELEQSTDVDSGDRLHFGLGTPRQLVVFDKFGHQDSLIGSKAPTQVFPAISSFLGAWDVTPASAYQRDNDRWVAALPWVGPVVGWTRRLPEPVGDATVAVSLVIRPSPMHARTRMLVLVPMICTQGRWQSAGTEGFRYWGNLSGQPVGIDATEDVTDIQTRLMAGAITLNVDPAQVDGVQSALLILTAHDDLPDWLQKPPIGIIPPNELRQRARDAVHAFFAQPHVSLDPLLLRLDAHVLAATDFGPGAIAEDRTTSLSFVVASCQYPHGLLDQRPAEASYQRLRHRLDETPTSDRIRPQALLLLGDQVYVDETAGVFEPSPAGGELDHAYDRNFRLPDFRTVISRVPTFMLLDDHEVANGWLPPVAPDQLAAFTRYRSQQSRLNPRRGDRSFSFRCAPGGWPLFVLDTRSRRQPRTPDNFDAATVVPNEVMQALKDWLLAQDADGPKFIGMASVLLPLERDAGQPRWSSDGWAGYPASRADLLGFIADEQIRNVVFLSGDPHLSMVSKVLLGGMFNPTVAVYSVVSSGLYAPWIFSNADASDFLLDGSFWLRRPPSDPSPTPMYGRIRSIAEHRNGFAIVHVARSADGSHQLQIELDAEDRCRRIVQPLDHPHMDWAVSLRTDTGWRPLGTDGEPLN